MADPRFYDNRGPFRLADLCAKAFLRLPEGADPGGLIYDVAGLAQAGAQHLTFFDGGRSRAAFLETQAGWCLVRERGRVEAAHPASVLVACDSVGHAFAAVARLLYPEHEMDLTEQAQAVHPTARIEKNVVLGPGVVIGPDAEIGEGSRLGAHTVIGRGVTVGANSRIGAHTYIGFAHVGDEVIVQPGAKIGTSGFGFASGPKGHTKLPQLGRVIVQDRVEIGANSTIDRGALGDTVIGEGCKIDNLVQIGHNSRLGRHCIMAGQSGVSGSSVLGDFVVVGGNSGISDHVTIGDRARFAGMSGVAFDLDGGRDYGGLPSRPIREWHKEMLVLGKLAKKEKRTKDEE